MNYELSIDAVLKGKKVQTRILFPEQKPIKNLFVTVSARDI